MSYRESATASLLQNLMPLGPFELTMLNSAIEHRIFVDNVYYRMKCRYHQSFT